MLGLEVEEGSGWGKLRGTGVALSRNFSSCSLARAVACKREIGWSAITSRLNSGFKPEIKQLKRNGGGRPTTRFAKRSNSVRYSFTVPRYVNLNKAPLGSS